MTLNLRAVASLCWCQNTDSIVRKRIIRLASWTFTGSTQRNTFRNINTCFKVWFMFLIMQRLRYFRSRPLALLLTRDIIVGHRSAWSEWNQTRWVHHLKLSLLLAVDVPGDHEAVQEEVHPSLQRHQVLLPLLAVEPRAALRRLRRHQPDLRLLHHPDHPRQLRLPRASRESHHRDRRVSVLHTCCVVSVSTVPRAEDETLLFWDDVPVSDHVWVVLILLFLPFAKQSKPVLSEKEILQREESTLKSAGI